jgi:hypothetical protein
MLSHLIFDKLRLGSSNNARSLYHSTANLLLPAAGKARQHLGFPRQWQSLVLWTMQKKGTLGGLRLEDARQTPTPPCQVADIL